MSVESRFWSKVDTSGDCWLWLAYVDRNGYGWFRFPGGHLAHRASWIFANGPIPAGLWVLHNCPGGDNPACVRPSHLWIGTNADNVRDRVKKGRSATGDRNGARTKPESRARGESNRSSKLKKQEVFEIRRLITVGASYRSLAAKFGVGKSTIANIWNNKAWRHLSPLSETLNA